MAKEQYVPTEHDIAHSLKHLVIADEAVVMADENPDAIFSMEALAGFYAALRNGHIYVFNQTVEQGIGHRVFAETQHSDFDRLGVAGRFAGNLGLHSTGLVIIEERLHGSDKKSEERNQAFARSFDSALGVLFGQ